MVQRKFTFAKLFAVVLMAVIGAVCCLTACGTQFNVTWNVDENATVTVEGKNELPATAGEGEELVFTVTPKAGYEVDDVKFNSATISPSGEKYTVKVEKDSTIDVTVKEKVEAIEVTKKPSKLTYFQGEALDKTGMEVAIKYATGRSEPITNYYIVYQGGNSATAFGLGDTSFQVRYAGKASDPVTLDSAVLAQVKIDLHGATLSETYLTNLKANTELSNVTVDGDMLAFTYAKALTKAIVLPTAAELTVAGEEGDYIFLGWSDGAAEITEIAAGSDTSLTIASQWDSTLVEFTQLNLVMKGNVPTLVIEGTFHAAQEVYLWLYEGNDKVELKGPTITGERGKAFTLEFDLRELSAEEYEGKYLGKWMDIKFRAIRGLIIDEQAINLDNYSDDFVDLEQYIHDDQYEYNFQVYERFLKVQYVDYVPHAFEVAIKAGTDNAGNATVTFEGTVLEEYYGKAVAIDWWIGASVEVVYAPIGSDGKFTLTLTLTPENGYTLNTKGYAHFWIVESTTDSTPLYGDNNSNFTYYVTNTREFTNNGSIGDGFIAGKSLRCASADGKYVYYVGKGDNGAVCVYGIDSTVVPLTIDFTKANLVVENGKVYLTVSGTCPNYTAEDFQMDLQNSQDWSYYPSEKGGVPTVQIDADGNFTVKFDITDANPATYLAHLCVAGNNKDFEDKTGQFQKVSVTAGDKTYTLEITNMWNRNMLTITIA